MISSTRAANTINGWIDDEWGDDAPETGPSMYANAAKASTRIPYRVFHWFCWLSASSTAPKPPDALSPKVGMPPD